MRLCISSCKLHSLGLNDSHSIATVTLYTVLSHPHMILTLPLQGGLLVLDSNNKLVYLHSEQGPGDLAPTKDILEACCS